jgi:ribosomal protein S18 acetylase RimI-like enzyme
MYKAYLEEREGKRFIEVEHGFVVYQFVDKWCYICDIYVEPEHRKSHVASKLADKVASVAREAGYEWLMGSVDVRAPGASVSLLSQLRYGFKLLRNDGQMIYLDKFIKREME